MCDPERYGIKITKEYCKNGFAITDLQKQVSFIDGNVTLYDIFMLIYRANTILPNITSIIGMPRFDLFLNQISENVDEDFKTNISYLELYWHPEYDVKITKKTGKSTDQTGISTLTDNDSNYWDDYKNIELSNLMGFHGIGVGCPGKTLDFHECDDDCPKYTGYAIELTPLNRLADLPIRISPIVDFPQPYVEDDKKLEKTKCKLTIYPTLWCFLTSILWELTFFGYTPNLIKQKSEEIDKICDEAKESMDNKENE